MSLRLPSEKQLAGSHSQSTELDKRSKAIDDYISWREVDAAQHHRVMFVSGRLNTRDPQEQNFFHMLQQGIAPMATPSSFSVFIVIFNVMIYLLMLESGGLDLNGDLLEVTTEALASFGGNFAPFVYQGQLWRLFTAIVVHVNLIHVVGNTFLILVFVTQVEHTYGSNKTILLYFGSGCCGNLLSNIFVPETLKGGASTALYGIIGVIVGYIFFNWPHFKLIGEVQQLKIILSTVLIAFMTVTFTGFSVNLDMFGHLGGMIGGILLSPIGQAIQEGPREKKIRAIFLTLYCLFVTVMVYYFFFQME